MKGYELISRLTDAERQSLRHLCRCCCTAQKIPGAHAEKLLQLGLAEMTCGGLGPTSFGRHAALSLQAGPAQPVG